MKKVRMNKTLRLVGTWPEWTFHKGTIYTAVPATNQPRWREEGKYFVSKRNGQSMLVTDEDFHPVK